MNIPLVIDIVVNNDLCVGCGLCIYKCTNNALEMKWNKYGFLIPELIGSCNSDGSCISVCPFNPFPEAEVKTENELAERFLQECTQYHAKIGKYFNVYAGYSNEFRLTSSSGGIATFVLAELLEKGIVDFIFSVKDSHKTGVYYEYSVSNTKEELLNASKTKYFPVTLATVLPKINELNGKVAVVGVACFIKAIRLFQKKEPLLKEKIPFLLGIICGGGKSRFFTEYLAGKTGVVDNNFEKPLFRIKDLNSTANDYSFGCFNKMEQKEMTLKMSSVGDMWGTGLFKYNACDFCDDVTTELADISLGDAWIPKFNNDGAGTNIIVTRSRISEEIIQEGIKKNKLNVEELAQEHFLISQQGSFNHRQRGLSFRINYAKNKGKKVPPKRFENEKINICFKLVQKLRMKARYKSLEIWAKSHDSKIFDKKMKIHLKKLNFATRIYHYQTAIEKKLNFLIRGKKVNSNG